MQMLRLKYSGHVERMSNDRWPRIIMHSDVCTDEEKDRQVRARRGTCMNLRQRLRQDMKDIGIDEKTWVAKANCRSEWRDLVGQGGLEKV